MPLTYWGEGIGTRPSSTWEVPMVLFWGLSWLCWGDDAASDAVPESEPYAKQALKPLNYLSRPPPPFLNLTFSSMQVSFHLASGVSNCPKLKGPGKPAPNPPA